MSHIDLRDLAMNVGAVLRGLNDGTTRHPLYVMDGDEPIGFVLRHQVYTPSLHLFTTNDDGWLVCGECSPAAVIGPKPLNLADAHQTANEHYRAVHYVRATHVNGGRCRYPHPDNTWASCYLQHRHDGAHQSAAGTWHANPDD